MTALALRREKRAELALLINQEQDAIVRGFRQHIAPHVRRAGDLLNQVKAQCSQGEWLPWLAMHCPGLSARSAQQYMRVASYCSDHPEKAKEIESDGLRAALEHIAVPRVPSNTKPVSHLDAEITSDMPSGEAIRVSRADTPTDEPERPDFDEDEDERIAAIGLEIAASVEKVMAAGDKLAAAHEEIKRQAAEIASLKLSRDGFMGGKAMVTKLLEQEQRKNERLTARLREADARTAVLVQQRERVEGEVEALRERLAIMEESM